MPAPAAGPALQLAWLGSGERAITNVRHALGPGTAPTFQAIGGSEGRVTAVEPDGNLVEVLQGQDNGQLGRVLALPSGGPAALSRAYLGDVAIAAVEPGGVLAVTVQRHYPGRFGAPTRIPIKPGPVTALTVAMDFRADVLVAWAQEGSIYAHLLRASGRSEATQRLGRSDPDPQLQATVSDNNHGMVAWSSTREAAGAEPRTVIRLALSGVNVRFAGSARVTVFDDPARVGHLAGSIALVRLAGENVMLAWTERQNGRYRVLLAPAVFAATRPPTIATAPGEQGALAGLAAGPANEAVVLWRRLGANPAHLSEAPLWAARATFAVHDRVALANIAQASAEGSAAAPALGVNPGDDHAVVAWLGRTGVRYSVASGKVGYRPHAYVPPASGGGSHPVAASVAGVLLVIIAAGWFIHLRRRRAHETGRIRRWPL
jgi:hypothetical protein